MHFVGEIGKDSQTNAPPLEAVLLLQPLLLSLGVQSHSLKMRNFLGNLAGRFSFQCNLLQDHTVEKGIICHFCYSLCFPCFILGEVARKISELHVLKCEGGMSEWRIVSRHLISICINLTKANVREKERVSVYLFQLLMLLYFF